MSKDRGTTDTPYLQSGAKYARPVLDRAISSTPIFVDGLKIA